MRRTQAFVLLSVLLFATFPCCAQMMEASEYRGFLKRLDASAVGWREHIASLNIDQLNVTFSLGKKLEGHKEICLRNLALVHDLIGRQLTKDRLSDDVNLNESLTDVSSMLGGILDIIPANEQSVHWAGAVPSLGKEISSYQSPLRKHILAYADQLQEKAAKCSR